MSRCYKYSVAQFRTEPSRNERLNLAILIFENDDLLIRAPRSLEKLRAISSAVDLDEVRDSIMELAEIDEHLRANGEASIEERAKGIQALSSISLSSFGEFLASSRSEVDRIADNLLSRLVDPEPLVRQVKPRRPTRLLSDLRSALRAERILARKGETLDCHRVLPDFKIAEGLPADFLLKNGAMHVVQAVDARNDDGSLRKAVAGIAVSALVFESARIAFGSEHTRSNLVYSASSNIESLITPSLDAAEHQGAKLVNWDSRNDRVRFVVELSSLADPLPTSTSGRRLVFHASQQGRLKLN